MKKKINKTTQQTKFHREFVDDDDDDDDDKQTLTHTYARDRITKKKKVCVRTFMESQIHRFADSQIHSNKT